MSCPDSIKNFFLKGRGVILGFPLLLLGAVLITINKLLAGIIVLIGIILLTVSNYLVETANEDELE